MSLRLLLGGIVTGIAAVAMCVLTSPSAVAAAPTGVSCGSSGNPVEVHYIASVGSDHVGHITGVDLSGFDAGCQGESAVLQLWGNPAGDPSVPMSGDTLLATLDSTMGPCSQQPLNTPLSVQSGSLNLTMCPSGGPAGDVSIHDLTLLALSVNGQSVPVVSAGNASQPKATTSSSEVPSALAFTGSSLELMVIAASLALMVGTVLVLMRRDRWKRALRLLGRSEQ